MIEKMRIWESYKAGEKVVTDLTDLKAKSMPITGKN
jgi:hypothetical protein